MDIPNAFIGRKDQPSQAEIVSALGPSVNSWNELVAWLAEEQGVDTQEWRSFSPKYGWSLRLRLKKRNIVYLSPGNGRFRVAFALGDRAVKAALQGSLAKKVKVELKTARRYAEGTGITVIVKRSGDLAAVRKLTLIKLAN